MESQHTMTESLQNTTNHEDTNQEAELTMSKKALTAKKIHEEILRFQQTMDELKFLKNITNDLRNYKRMLYIKRND